MKYQGIVRDQGGNLPDRRTRTYDAYQEAHQAAEKLCKRTYGSRGLLIVCACGSLVFSKKKTNARNILIWRALVSVLMALVNWSLVRGTILYLVVGTILYLVNQCVVMLLVLKNRPTTTANMSSRASIQGPI